jgi:hypothetical protein
VRAAFVAGAVLLAGGCGYIGPPLPPSTAIPQHITDLAIVERGDAVLAQFTLPALTTQGLALRDIRAVELRAGVTPNPWNAAGWASAAHAVHVSATGPGALTEKIPIDPDWIGKEITVAVRTTGPRGKNSDWSNFRQITLAAPLAAPSDFKAANTSAGVTLTWQGAAGPYHLFRGVGDAPPDPLGDSEKPEYVDSPVEYGTAYSYYVQAFNGDLQQSEAAGPQKITPEDIFAPAVPAGLTAEQGTGAIELSWERNTEPRFQGYNIYRSVEGGPFEKIAALIAAPTYSDHGVQSGKKYRYQVSAAGTNGKESERSTPVEITAQ